MSAEKINNMVSRWAHAEETADTAQLDELLADDFLGIGPKGFVLTKQQWLHRFSGGLIQESIKASELQVKEYDRTFIVVGKQSQKVSYNGSRGDGDFRMSQTWVADNGGYRLALLQYGMLAPDMPGRQ